MATDLKSIYQGSLSATHAAEEQGLRQMEAQLSGMEGYAEYQALLRRHIEATHRQIERLDRALADVGDTPSAVKEAVTNAVGIVGAAVHGLFPDTQLKNLYAGYAYQHEQIAAYESLAIIAEQAGYPQHRSWIEQTLTEEREGAKAAEALIEPVTREYLRGATAG